MMIWIALIAAVFAALVLLLRGSGPRVTTIEHRRDDDDEGGD